MNIENLIRNLRNSLSNKIKEDQIKLDALDFVWSMLIEEEMKTEKESKKLLNKANRKGGD